MKTKQGNKVRLLLSALILSLSVVFMAAGAQAATNVNLKNCTSFKISKIKKTAKKVKKGKNYHVVGKVGYLKFTAPKTKTYSFTIGNLSGADENIVGTIEVGPQLGSGMNSKLLKTKGGKGYTLSICTQSCYDTQGIFGELTYSTPLPTRTGKLKLKKGTTVYIRVNLAYLGQKGAMNLKIS